MKINQKFLKITVLITVLGSIPSFAMDIGGLKLGVGPKLSLNANKASVGSAAKSSSFGVGWGAGVYSLLDLDSVAFELGLQYSERRFSFKNLLGVSGDFAATLKQIEIPVLAYYKHTLNELLALRLGAGAQFDFGVSKVKGDVGSMSYSDSGLSKNQTSLLLDIGGDYKFDALGTVTFDLRYAYGLNDRSKGSGVFSDKYKTQYIDFGVGFLF